MSEELEAPVEQPVNDETDKLKADLRVMKQKNAELLDEYKKISTQIKNVPEDVNIQELIDFKHNAEQSELEEKGRYSEARQKLETQFREKSAEKDKRIAELEARVRELELVSPAVSSLAELVHDPQLVLKNFLPTEKIEVDNGIPVVVDGYERTPVGEWAKSKLPDYILKQPKPQGGGASANKGGSNDLPVGMKKNPFEDGGNITEQMRLWRTDRDLYNRLKSAVKR